MDFRGEIKRFSKHDAYNNNNKKVDKNKNNKKQYKFYSNKNKGKKKSEKVDKNEFLEISYETCKNYFQVSKKKSHSCSKKRNNSQVSLNKKKYSKCKSLKNLNLSAQEENIICIKEAQECPESQEPLESQEKQNIILLSEHSKPETNKSNKSNSIILFEENKKTHKFKNSDLLFNKRRDDNTVYSESVQNNDENLISLKTSQISQDKLQADDSKTSQTNQNKSFISTIEMKSSDSKIIYNSSSITHNLSSKDNSIIAVNEYKWIKYKDDCLLKGLPIQINYVSGNNL